jgi:hypothetical protein
MRFFELNENKIQVLNLLNYSDMTYDRWLNLSTVSE